MKKPEGSYSPGEICCARALRRPTGGAYSHPRAVKMVLISLAAHLQGLHANEGVKLDEEACEHLTDNALKLITLLGTYDPSES